MYVNNATRGGPVHQLFTEFERRVHTAIMLTPPKSVGARESQSVRFFWDQNLFNKVRASNA